MLRFHVVGGRGEPRSDEHLEVDGDRFSLWRSAGVPTVGRFAGSLPADVVGDIASASEEIAREEPPVVEMPPDAALETLELPDAPVALLGQGVEPPGALGRLVVRLRGLMDELTDQPVAAVGLEIDEGWTGARLVHRGSDPVQVDVSELRVSVYAWKGYYEPAGRWQRGPIALEAAAEAGPGWSVDLPFDHDLPTGQSHSLQVAVDFRLLDGEAWRSVSAARVPVIEPPRRGRKG